jgi:tetratricopeptide (TPR) repeat protein
MKWFNESAIKFKNIFSRANPKEELLNFRKGKKLYLSNQLSEALFYFDNAIALGSDVKFFKLRAKCLQKLNRHSQAIEDFDQLIEDNPLEFSNYYRRAISKKAIADLKGQIEDITACIYYYKKNKNLENTILKNIEKDLIDAANYIESIKNSIISIHNVPYAEIKNGINECLRQIKKIRLQDNRFTKLKNNEMLLQS